MTLSEVGGPTSPQPSNGTRALLAFIAVTVVAYVAGVLALAALFSVLPKH